MRFALGFCVAAISLAANAGADGREEGETPPFSPAPPEDPQPVDNPGDDRDPGGPPLDTILGSLCVGDDCLAAESFGFDTLRLKENNLRIHFDDTSVAASFPANDWRLYANDSANGGSMRCSMSMATVRSSRHWTG